MKTGIWSTPANGGRRLAAVCLALGFGLLGALAGPVGVSAAAETHVLGSTIGGGVLTNPGSVAVDEAHGEIYVFDFGSNQVMRFNEDGTPANFALLGSPPGSTNVLNGSDDEHGDQDDNHRGGWFTPWQIAVDNSGGPNDGVLYVSMLRGVDVFSHSGQYLTTIEGKPTSNEQQGPESTGVATDVSGGLYIAYMPQVLKDPGFVSVFHPREWNPLALPALPVQSRLIDLPRSVFSLAASRSGAVYLNTSPNNSAPSPAIGYPAGSFDFPEPAGATVADKSTGIAVDSKTDEVYVSDSKSVTRHDSGGDLVERFGQGELTFGDGISVAESSGRVYVSDLQAGDIKVYHAVITPDIDGISVAAGRTTASVSAEVGTAGAGSVTACTVDFGPDDTYGSSAACTPPAPLQSATSIAASITGLVPETTYHYRIAATNANGTTHSIDRVFTTHAVSGVSTGRPKEVGQHSATLTGSFSGEGEEIHYHFEWGTDTAYGNSTPDVSLDQVSGSVPAEAPIAGLEAYTPTSPTYHYRLVASNVAGTTYGQDETFHSSPPSLPAVKDVIVSTFASGAALLGATINPGGGITSYRFVFGTDPGELSVAAPPLTLDADSVDHPVSVEIGDLVPGSAYTFRVIATNFGGTTIGPIRTFTPPDRPTVESASVVGITSTGATVQARIRPGAESTSYSAVYGQAGAGLVSSTGSQLLSSTDNEPHLVQIPIAGLSPDTAYRLQVVASNSLGMAPDSQVTFRTAAGSNQKPPLKKCKAGFRRRGSKCLRKRRPRRHSGSRHPKRSIQGVGGRIHG